MALKRWIEEPERPDSSSTAEGGSALSLAKAQRHVNHPSARSLVPPIRSGWLVAYHGQDGRLRGGWED